MKSHINPCPGVTWVGARNPDLRRFDVVMHTEYGTTYNAYLIVGNEKTALVETVKDRFMDEQLQRIGEIADVQSIDYIILNHTEPDHSGALPALLQRCPAAKVYCSRPAAALLKNIVHEPFDCTIVGDGDCIDLGGVTLEFIMAPFLHWPDTMFTYCREKRLLFSGDVFGCHYSSEEMLESALGDAYLRAQRYYFDVIMGPFKSYVLSAVEKIRPLDIQTICPSHGPILDRTPWDSVERYAEWAADCRAVNSPKKVFIGYVSCYGYTAQLGQQIQQAVLDAGLDAEFTDVGTEPAETLAQRVNSADGVLIGSPTLNRDVLPPVWQLLTQISAICCKGKAAGAFGSYGWSGEACGFIEERLKNLGFRVLGSVRTKLRPTQDALREAYEFGKAFAAELTKA